MKPLLQIHQEYELIGKYKGAMEIVNRLFGRVDNAELAEALEDFKDNNPMHPVCEVIPENPDAITPPASDTVN